jgi:hypothetical protein
VAGDAMLNDPSRWTSASPAAPTVRSSIGPDAFDAGANRRAPSREVAARQ